MIGAKTKDVEGWTQTGLIDGSFAKDGGSYKKSCGDGTLVSNSYLSYSFFMSHVDQETKILTSMTTINAKPALPVTWHLESLFCIHYKSDLG